MSGGGTNSLSPSGTGLNNPGHSSNVQLDNSTNANPNISSSSSSSSSDNPYLEALEDIWRLFETQCPHAHDQSQNQGQGQNQGQSSGKLSHKHLGSLSPIKGRFAIATAQSVVISLEGKTPLWSGSFSGCIGVVMRGNRSWGAVAHLHQNIQDQNQNLALALSTLAAFIRGQTNDQIREVLLYFGDAGANRGERQNQADPLTKDRVKELMGCGKVIDRRRTQAHSAPHGSEFVYDPGSHVVYTTSQGGAGAAMLDFLGDDDNDITPPQLTPFPYPDEATKNLVGKGLGGKGWFSVP
jgi:hypothetical protein